MTGHLTLRPYQASAIEELRAALREGAKRICLYSPTGSGKTEIAIAMIISALGKGKRVSFVVNRIELGIQALRRIRASGIDAGLIQGDNSCNTSAAVVICSVQTVAKRGLPDCDLIVIDECHGVPGSKAYVDLLKSRNNLPVIGLSATPFTQGMGRNVPNLGLIFERLVSATSIRELIEQGFLVDVEVYAPSAPDLSEVKVVAGDYQQTQLGKAVDKAELVGDIVTHWQRLAGGKSSVCFATNIAHSLHIVEQFQRAGVSAEHLDCYASDDERQAVLGRVRSGKTTIICNVGILAEGWDFPACEVMILARPTKSLTRYLQMAGRILRPFPGKTRGLILDHSGTVARLGFPTDDLPLLLDDGKPKKSATQPQEKPLPKPGPTCTYMKPSGQHECPQCGFKPVRQSDVEVQEGQLVKLERKKPLKRETGQFIYSQLLGYAKNQGYQPGWAFHRYREFTGKEARGLRQVPATPTPEILNWITSRNIAHAKSKGGRHASCV